MQERKTQAEKIKDCLELHKGEWVNGRYFNDTMHITQFHTRIHELQRRGFNIEASNFKDEYGFKSYRLINAEVKALLPKSDTGLTPASATNCCYSMKVFNTHAQDCRLIVEVKENNMLF